MRTTVRIEDSLLADLKQQARDEQCSLTTLINRVLRRGMRAGREDSRPSEPYRETTYRMGPPKVDPRKALALAAALEDEETTGKLLERK